MRRLLLTVAADEAERIAWAEGKVRIVIGRTGNPGTDYRGAHRAPDRESGAPLWDLTLNGVYPDDVYSPQGPRIYGNRGDDSVTWAAVRSAHNRPARAFTVYRAVPLAITREDRIRKIREDQAYILRTGRIPRTGSMRAETASKEYEALSRELEYALSQPEDARPTARINPGDWVTLERSYAVGHGQSALHGEYRVIQKTVPASTLFTAGDSIMEWGYDP